MKFYYDLHIHSDLSPCGNTEMTPNNIVNMACIKDLNIISVTDHNSINNYPAIKSVGDKLGIEVIPGIEVTTKEEVHVLCYFRKYSDAQNFGKIIYDSLPDINNNPLIFGEQNIYNSEDEKIGKLDKLLINATSYTINELFDLTKVNHGISVPAHINKKSNSILGILGFIPFNLNISFVEVFQKLSIDEKLIRNYNILKNSDAHQLVDISEPENSLELDDIEGMYDYLKL
jgi:PHP family Zn ribbon phosphoesterase